MDDGINVVIKSNLCYRAKVKKGEEGKTWKKSYEIVSELMKDI
jgi:hypothetical protein